MVRLLIFSFRDERLFYSATGLFHGGSKKLDGTLKKGEFFRFVSGEQVSFVCLVVSAPSKRLRAYRKLVASGYLLLSCFLQPRRVVDVDCLLKLGPVM